MCNPSVRCSNITYNLSLVFAPKNMFAFNPVNCWLSSFTLNRLKRALCVENEFDFCCSLAENTVCNDEIIARAACI